ncbi:immunoglobulin heavy chain constant region [Pelobates cultripes]|nr:immunoglobulin heavy chain constant region [Pelobates cultripes]
MPSPVEITWTGGSKISSVRSTKPVLGATDGLFTQSGQISIPASELKNNPVQCSVAHSFSGTNQKKTLRALPCTQPTVQLLLQPPCANADLFKAAVGHKNINTTLDLVCLISNFYPQNIRVQWLVNGKEDVSASATVPVPLKANDGLFTANSHLTILEGKWNKGTGYSCIVTHIASKIDTVANISKCTEPCSDSLEIYLIPPTFEDLYIKRNAKIVCFVNNMRTTENVEVIWTRENGNVTFITEDPILHDNGTYSMYSYLKICSEDWETGEKFTCTVKSQDLPSPLKKVIFKHNERTPSAPYVYILPPANEEIEQKELASITCFVSTFYPNDILIKWLDGGNEVSVDKYVNTAPIKKDDGTYVMYSYLTVSANKWKDGNVFTCVVGHEALPYYIRQQSIDKSSGFESSLANDECTRDLENVWFTASTFMVLFLVSLFYTATVTVFKKSRSQIVVHLRRSGASYGEDHFNLISPNGATLRLRKESSFFGLWALHTGQVNCVSKAVCSYQNSKYSVSHHDIKSMIKSTKPVLGATDGLFTQSGQISIPASELKNNPVQCSVAHSFSGTNQKKTLRALPCTQPTVQLLLQPPCANADLFKAAVGHKNINTTLDLVCLISNFYPQNIRVQWLVNGKEDVSASATVPVPLKANDGLFTANSHLTILEGKWNKGTGYSCIVTHIASKIDTVANISKCTEPCSDSLEIYLIPPTFEDLYIKRNAKIVCFVNNMRTTENVEVIWTRENGNVTFITEDPILHDNGTYSMYSYLKICSEDWETGEKFTCTVKSQDLPSPLKKVIFKHNERTPSAPYVYILPPANEEIEQKELASITCFVSTFYPNDILIKWLDGGNEVSVDKYVNTAPIKKDDGTYVMYSYLTVSANKWKDGNVFTCVVGHEALPYYIRQQSIDKSSGKPTNVNVSLVMSETLSACH